MKRHSNYIFTQNQILHDILFGRITPISLISSVFFEEIRLVFGLGEKIFGSPDKYQVQLQCTSLANFLLENLGR